MSVLVFTILLTGFLIGDIPEEYETLKRDGLILLQSDNLIDAEKYLLKAFEKASRKEKVKIGILLSRAQIGLKKEKSAIKTLGYISKLGIPPHLKSFLDFEKTRALALANDPQSERWLQFFINTYQTSRYRGKAHLLFARLLYHKNKKRDAIYHANMALSKGLQREEKAEALSIIAKSHKDKKSLLRQIFIEFPETMHASLTGLKEDDLTIPELLKRADAFRKQFDYEEAHRILQKVWEMGEKTPKIAYQLAISHLNLVRDDPRKAIDFLDIAEAGGAISREEAIYQRARAWAKLEDYEKAIQEWKRYLSEGHKKRKVEALYYLGWLPYDHEEYEKALPHFDRFLDEVKKHELYSYIIWAKGWSLYKLKRYREAIQVFEEMIPLGNPLVAGKAMYWGGMSFHWIGEKEKAVEWMERVLDTYPLTYYAVLAAKRLSEWGKRPLPVWITGEKVVSIAPKADFLFYSKDKMIQEKLSQIKDLSEIGEIEEARAIWKDIEKKVIKIIKDKKTLAQFLLWIGEYIQDYNWLYQTATKEFSTLLGSSPNKDNALFWMAVYPMAHRGFASLFSKRFDIPEMWVYAIMRQESRYTEKAISHTAALGLMQMIPKTAKIIANALGDKFDTQSFFFPARNMLFCIYYLASLLKEFKGQIIFASAAYNAGAPPIKKFMLKHKGLSLDEMVEHIAYNEARNYCRKVAEHLIRYAYLHLSKDERIRLYKALFPDTVDYDFLGQVNY